MVQPNAAAYVGVPADPGRYCWRRPNRFESMRNRRQRRGFEQKAAKETKGIVLGFL
jgi:hypothetical protein